MHRNNSKSRIKLAVSLVIIPVLLAISSLVILVVINMIFNPTFWMTPDTAPVTPTPLYVTVLNGVFITIGAIGLLSLLPCLITAVYLFEKEKQLAVKNTIS